LVVWHVQLKGDFMKISKPKWNPKKTYDEMKKDPWRAIRAANTGGLSELPRAGGPLGDLAKDVAKPFEEATDKIGGAFKETPKPDTSGDDADIAAAKALYGSSVDDFVKEGPTKYNKGADLGFESYDVGESLNLDQIGALDQLGPSDMSKISTDPRYKDAELAALTDLEDRSKNGFTDRDRADLAKLEGDVNRQNRGRLGAIQQQMASRGMSGSGMDLLAQVSASQDATERQALAALEKNAQMSERKVDATSRLGNLGSQLQSKDFSQQAQQAQAQDAINRFNTQNSVQRTLSNNDIVNQGKTQNWNRANSTSDKNTDGRNDTTKSNWSRTNQTSDNNSQAQGMFNTQKLGARQGQSQFNYDAAADSKNAKMSDWQAKENARRAKLGAVTGLAGGGIGAYFGGVEGAKAGQSMGQGAGGFFAEGGEVEDSYLDDVVPVMVSPGEKILPKSVTSEGIHKEAAFVERTEAEEAIKGLLDAMAYLTKKRS
jgi:hypothetical protein